jgi:hypothetical protein
MSVSLSVTNIENNVDRYRWYACELLWNHDYKCKRVEGLLNNPVNSRMIPVHKNIPELFDGAILRGKLLPIVTVEK